MDGRKTVNAEKKRLQEDRQVNVHPWQKWGPYVSERSWGTVREDYSFNGDAWSYFTHHDALTRAYRWGEDGIAGFCDRYQRLVFAPAFWNGKDPILKERLFGLGSDEGNHGEDVKELYYHLDGIPSHAYMKFLYKYPQNPFPYNDLVEQNRNRSSSDPEYELLDTHIFDDNAYFDIFIEYAKNTPEDLCIKIDVHNRGNNDAPLHVIPHLWFRNQWSWEAEIKPKPVISKGAGQEGIVLIADDENIPSPLSLSFDYKLGKRYLYGPPGGTPLFTENETRRPEEGFYKDGFHRAIIHHEKTVNPQMVGTKSCIDYVINVSKKSSVTLYFRLTDQPMQSPLKEIGKIVEKRKKEADEFYQEVLNKGSDEEKMIQRQALAGLLWNKQIYLFDVNQWLKGDNSNAPPPESRQRIRNHHWQHLNSMRVMLMPDKWEYPWFAAWDHAFHCLTIGLIDLDFAKEQLWLLLFDQFQHPNGSIPACEWEFSDLNPPVQGWVALHLFEMGKTQRGEEDFAFLEKCFHKLLMNFSYWVNRVDSSGNNVFEGGFLGLDNITVLDRSQRFAEGVKLEQSDGTGWMAMFCLNLMKIALILSRENSVYQSLATKFFQHFVYIAEAMKKRGHVNYEIWSEKDGFFYDVLTYADGRYKKFRVRSLVGIIPMYAAEILNEHEMMLYPEFYQNFHWFIRNRSKLTENCVIPLDGNRYLLSLVNEKQLTSILHYICDPNEFCSPFGLRSLSKYHEKNPFIFEDKKVGYEPAESSYKVKGGNSNWRGPIWFPTTSLLIDSLLIFSEAFGDKIRCDLPGKPNQTLRQIALSFADRLTTLFKKDSEGKRPVFGPQFPFHHDPNWSDYLLYYEYFNPETGQGLGASHQTGWTALVANIIRRRHLKN